MKPSDRARVKVRTLTLALGFILEGGGGGGDNRQVPIYILKANLRCKNLSKFRDKVRLVVDQSSMLLPKFKEKQLF